MTQMRDLTVPTVLLLKCHTSGLYRTDLDREDEGQPFLMEVAAALCNEAGVVTNHMAHLIKPEGRRAKDGAVAKHGLSDWALAQVGIPLPRVMGALGDMLKTSVMEGMKVVTFNDFDPKVVTAAFSRVAVGLNKTPGYFDRLWYARPLTEFIALQHPYCQLSCHLESEVEGADYRWPTLEEAASIVLKRELEPMRDAWTDLMVLKDLYFHFLAAGHFEKAAA